MAGEENDGDAGAFISVIYIFAAVSQYHKNNPDDDPQEDPAQVEQNVWRRNFPSMSKNK